MSDRPTPRTKPYEGVWATEWIGGKSIYEHACDLEREADELREALSDAETTLRHCRLFVVDRKGYQSDEKKERDDLKQAIDTALERSTALNTEPKKS